MSYAKQESTYNTQADNTAVVVTIPAWNNSPRILRRIIWSLDGTPESAIALTATSGGSTLFSVDVIQGGPGFLHFDNPGMIGANTSTIVVTLAAAVNTAGKLTVFADDS